MRKAGILLHVSSLPNKYGIGTFGKSAYEFVDFLCDAGQTFWQVLPLGPTSFGDSPYQNFSAFAGNPYFIDFDILKDKGLLKEEEYCYLENENKRVDYEEIYKTRFTVLKKAFKRFKANSQYKDFISKNSYWLDEYSLFMAIKNYQVEGNWHSWEEKYVKRDKKALDEFRLIHDSEIEFWKFLQYEFYLEWISLKNYANSRGIKIIGDMPIYVAYDSSDVWSEPKYWQLDEDLNPTVVAGCPPDYFTPKGQLWGNPIYDYDLMEREHFSWWIKRLKKSFELYDIVRIDHFRGFEAYYSIPAKDETAEFGHWVKGPGMKLFNEVNKELGNASIIAEDLGFLTEEVHQLLRDCGYPGMKILEFAFGADEDGDYLPHNHIPNCVVYTGTHDNLTVKSWLKTLGEREKDFCYKYVGIDNDEEAVNKIIKCALGSVANYVIIPLVDYMQLGDDARFNTPSTLDKMNWSWRLDGKCLDRNLSNKIREFCGIYRRI